MENIELELQLADIEKEIDHRLNIRRELRQQLADANCPFIIGEKVINKRGDKAEVIRIKWSCFSEGYKLVVKKIKKNGDLYQNESEAWHSDQWKKIN